MKVVEEIKWNEDTYLVEFKVISHPFYTGDITNKIEKHENGDLYLTYEMFWKVIDEGSNPMAGLQMKMSVEDSIKYIEESYATSLK